MDRESQQQSRVFSYTHGRRWGSPVNEKYDFPVTTFHERKDGIIKSDHHRPTPYSVVGEGLSDSENYVIRTVWPGADTDLFESNPISGSLPDLRSLDIPIGVTAAVDNCIARVLTKARLNFRDKSSFEAGAALGESKETVEMLSSTAAKLAAALLAARRGDWGAVARHLNMRPKNLGDVVRSIDNAWLEYQYGWKPLVFDLHGLFERLNTQLKTAQQIRTGSKWSEDVISVDRGSRFANIQLNSKFTCFAHASYTASLTSEAARSMESWGIINPASVAWELVPYSFVVDWFIPIGNCLSAMTATAGLEVLHGYLSYGYKGETQASFIDFHQKEWYGYERYLYEPGLTTFSQNRWIRKPLEDWEPPRLYANNNPWNSKRAKNALALATQLILGR